MSNRMTEARGENVIRFARQLGINRVNLMFDCDEPGTEGAKDALRFFTKQQIDVRPAWSPAMHESKFKDGQPESLSEDDLATVIAD